MEKTIWVFVQSIDESFYNIKFQKFFYAFEESPSVIKEEFDRLDSSRLYNLEPPAPCSMPVD